MDRLTSARVVFRRRTSANHGADERRPTSTTEATAAGADLKAQNLRLRAELAAEIEERRRLIDALGQGVISVDRNLRIVAANPVADGFLGRPPGGLVGRTVIEAFLDLSVESLAEGAMRLGSARGEINLSEGGDRRLSIRALRSSSGGAWLVLEDVSELRRLQRIRTEFVDNLSHELRTPLTTVGLLAETLARDADAAGGAIPAKMRERIARIEIETTHLVQIASELMDLSRIESGSEIQLLDLVDLGQTARDSVERLRLFAERQGVALQVYAPAVVPSVRGDAARLAQVYINLLHNAVKFSPNDGEVLVSIGVDDDQVVASVIDKGVGIARGAQERIFERFYKVDSARVRRGDGGTGLGLAIARHIVEQHGGSISVESVEGKGSTFRFAIPRAETDA